MRLTEDLYLVGGGNYAFNISHRLDCHTYVVDVGEELWMIDAGFDGAEQVLANIRNDGLDPRDISRIFVTHYHADHVGALAEVTGLVGDEGLQVAVGADAAPAIRTADDEQNGLRWAQTFNFYPSEFVWQPTPVQVELSHGQRFETGEHVITAISTPGHCKGHYCYLVEGGDRPYLFTGDHVFWGGQILLQNVMDSSVQDYAASTNRLLEYDFEALLPGHMTLSLRNGRRHIEQAADQFNKIGLPPNMIV